MYINKTLYFVEVLIYTAGLCKGHISYLYIIISHVRMALFIFYIFFFFFASFQDLHLLHVSRE